METRIARRVLIGAALALPSAPAAAAAAELDSLVRQVFVQDGPDQARALQQIVARRDTGAVAPLVQALYWLRPEDPAIDRTLAALTGAPLHGWFDWAVWQQDHPEITPYPG